MRIQSITFYFPLKLEHAASKSLYLEFINPYEAPGFRCLYDSFCCSTQSSYLLEHPTIKKRTIRYRITVSLNDGYSCVRKPSNPVSAAHPVFASAEPEYGYGSGFVIMVR